MTLSPEWYAPAEPHEHTWGAPGEPTLRSDGWYEVTKACTGSWYGAPCPITIGTILHRKASNA